MAPNMGSAAPSRADHGRDHGQGTFRDHGQGEPTDTEPSITVIARSRSKRGAQAPRSRDNDRDRVPRITIAIDPVGTRSVKTGSYYYITVAIAPPLCAGCKPRKVLQKRKWGFGKNIRLGQDTLLSTDVIHLARRKAKKTLPPAGTKSARRVLREVQGERECCSELRRSSFEPPLRRRRRNFSYLFHAPVRSIQL